MTDQFITDKRAELTNLSSEYKQLADQLLLIRDNFTAKTIKEMIDAGIVYLTCDHKTVSTLNETDPYSHLVTKCENCHAELNKVGEYFLNKNEQETLYRIKQQRGAGIYTDYLAHSKPPVTAILKKREGLGHSLTPRRYPWVFPALPDGQAATHLVHPASDDRLHEVCYGLIQ